MPERIIRYTEALREAFEHALATDPAVFLLGLGVSDPTGIYGTTKGLVDRFGPDRVLETPTAENAMTGVAIGAALDGFRPVMSHHRVDFALLAMEQIVNQAAKWHYMFGGQKSVPLVVRMVIGRGWGQGPQHSQSLQSWFAHIPGLRVIMPTFPDDAKGMMLAAIADPNPVVILEHRWVHGIKGHVTPEAYTVPLDKARVVREGTDITLVGVSFMTVECLRVADELAKSGVKAEVIDLRSIRPIDSDAILRSVAKTGRLIVADTSWSNCGVGAEVLAIAVERGFANLRAAPSRFGLADCPAPTSPALADHFYPRAGHILAAARAAIGLPADPADLTVPPGTRLDVPDPSFQGPF